MFCPWALSAIVPPLNTAYQHSALALGRQSQFYLMSMNNLACALDPFPSMAKVHISHFYFNQVIVNVRRTGV